MKLSTAIAASCLVPLAAVVLSPASAQGTAPPKGLFAEASITADGATVRRIVDPENGVVCYLTTSGWHIGGYVGGQGSLVAISCVRLHGADP